MLSTHITIRLAKHDEIVNKVDEFVQEMKFDILKLPKEEQSTHWKNYNLIKDYVDNSHQVIFDMVTELHPLPSQQSIKDLHLTIIKLRRYIEDLGGNPSIVNYIKLSDL
jgi:hypothetical protein